MMPLIASWIRSAPVTLCVAALAVVAYVNPDVTGLLELHLQHPKTFGVATLLGCHVLHWSGEHLFWDLVMFVGLGLLCERSSRWCYYLTLVAGAVAIPLAVQWSAPWIETYRGLSGLDTAIFSLLLTNLLWQDLQHNDRRQLTILWLPLIGLWCKIGFEFYCGKVIFVQQTNFVPLPIAHAVGALLGSLIASLRFPILQAMQRVSPDGKAAHGTAGDRGRFWSKLGRLQQSSWLGRGCLFGRLR